MYDLPLMHLRGVKRGLGPYCDQPPPADATMGVSLTYEQLRLAARICRWHADLVEDTAQPVTFPEVVDHHGAICQRLDLGFLFDLAADRLSAREKARSELQLASNSDSVRRMHQNGMGIPEIIAKTGLSKATVYRFLAVPKGSETVRQVPPKKFATHKPMELRAFLLLG